MSVDTTPAVSRKPSPFFVAGIPLLLLVLVVGGLMIFMNRGNAQPPVAPSPPAALQPPARPSRHNRPSF